MNPETDTAPPIPLTPLENPRTEDSPPAAGSLSDSEVSLAGTPSGADQSTDVDSGGNLNGPACERPSDPSRESFSRRWFSRIWRYLFGVISCMTPVSAVWVVGWSFASARRETVRYWWRRAGKPDGTFETFVSRHAHLREMRRPPRWILASDADEIWQARRRMSVFRRWLWPFPWALGSLRRHLIVGFRGALNAFLVMLPAGALMAYSWFFGWDISFTKGYEQFSVGALTGIIGLVLFVTVMLYLPVAQARQAVSGNARAFYHLGLIRKAIRRQWISVTLLSLAFTLMSLPLFVGSSILGFLAGNVGIADRTPPEALAFLHRYYLGWCLWVFPAFVWLRHWAARRYAGGIFQGLRLGDIQWNELSDFERKTLECLHPERWEAVPVRGKLWRGTGAVLSLWGRVVASFCMIGFGFFLIAQTYVTQFFAYQSPRPWFHYPLIQLPWYHFVPGPLETAVQEWKEADEESKTTPFIYW